jgi:hypothetical protein
LVHLLTESLSLHLVVEPRHFQSHVYQNYRASVIVTPSSLKEKLINHTSQVTLAEVVPFAQLQEAYESLVTHIDPTDFTRLRYVISLQNENGEVLRVRLLQWNSSSVESWRALPKNTSKELAESACEALMYSVEHTPVDVVRQKLRLSK